MSYFNRSYQRMEPSLDKVLLGMTLEEDEEPYTIPDRPEFFSTERNAVSLVGRLLNPSVKRCLI